MKTIETNEELLRINSVGRGFVFNDYGKVAGRQHEWSVLHSADCDHLLKAEVTTPKYFFDSLDEALEWLREEQRVEGEGWKRCGTCLA